MSEVKESTLRAWQRPTTTTTPLLHGQVFNESDDRCVAREKQVGDEVVRWDENKAK